MTTKVFTLRALLIAVCFGQTSCDDTKDADIDSEVWTPCDHYCGLLADIDYDYGSCMDVCVGADAQAEAVGSACGDVYRELLACIGGFRNNEAEAWTNSRKLGASDKYEWACEEQSAAFLKECPGVWYNE